MSKTLIGVVSYGGIRFLELFVRSVQETLTASDTDLLIVVAKPGDSEMVQWCQDRNFRHVVNQSNIGFAGSINDIYDAAFVDGSYDSIIFAGNDVVCLPGTLDHMIETSRTTEHEVLCGAEFDVRFLVNQYPEAREYFHGPELELKDFTTRPWELHKERLPMEIRPGAMSDVRNLTLFKRRVFEMIGYDNINYWPNSYFCDNEINLKCGMSGIKVASLPHAAFYHAWSRTIKQGENRDHGKYFERNRQFYVTSWGGMPGQERYALPFNGQPYTLPGSSIVLPPTLEIPDRDQEAAIIDYWRNL